MAIAFALLLVFVVGLVIDLLSSFPVLWALNGLQQYSSFGQFLPATFGYWDVFWLVFAGSVLFGAFEIGSRVADGIAGD